MLIDCHLHTTRYSRCSRLDPDDAAQLARVRGMDAVVLTEHHQLWPGHALDELAGRHPGLRLFTGVEITLEEGLDIVIIPSDTSMDWPFFPRFADIRPMLEAVRDEIFLFVAHPFRWMDMATREQEAVFACCDGMEMNSVNILKGGWRKAGHRFEAANASLYLEACEKHALIPVYNTDGHLECAVGALCNDIDTPALPRSQEELVRLLQKAHPMERQQEDTLTSCLAMLSASIL